MAESIKCACCPRKFVPVYRNGIPTSKYHPNCRYKRAKQKESRAEKTIKREKKKKEKTPRQKAMDLADTWFSRFIRIKYAVTIATDGTPVCKCIVTGKLMAANMLDNGHCFSRDFKLTRYEEDNCRPQNRSSNRYRGEADHYIFEKNLIAEIGQERFDRINDLRKQEGEDTEAFYKEQAEKYKREVNRLVKDLGVTKWW